MSLSFSFHSLNLYLCPIFVNRVSCTFYRTLRSFWMTENYIYFVGQMNIRILFKEVFRSFSPILSIIFFFYVSDLLRLRHHQTSHNLYRLWLQAWLFWRPFFQYTSTKLPFHKLLRLAYSLFRDFSSVLHDAITSNPVEAWQVLALKIQNQWCVSFEVHNVCVWL